MSQPNAIVAYFKALGTGLVSLVQHQPIRALAVVRSVILVVLAFWPGLLSSDQQFAILTLAAVLFGADEVARSNVTPTAAPVLPAGTSVVTPAGHQAVVKVER